MSDGAQDWSDALTACALLAICPQWLGGIVLRGQPGPARQELLRALQAALPAAAPFRRVPSHIDDDRLSGGIDLPSTLATGRSVLSKGLLVEADGGALVVPMAERLPGRVAAQIAAALDEGLVRVERDGLGTRHDARICVVACDEALDGDGDAVPRVLS